jgi:hypothetical protein
MAPSETIVNNYNDSPQHGVRDDLLRGDGDDDSPRSLRDDDPVSLDDSSYSGDSSSGDGFV